MLNDRKIYTEILKQWQKKEPLGRVRTPTDDYVTANKFALVRLPAERNPFRDDLYTADLTKGYGKILSEPVKPGDEAELTNEFMTQQKVLYLKIRRKADGRIAFFRASLCSFIESRSRVDYYLTETDRKAVVLVTAMGSTKAEALFATLQEMSHDRRQS